MRPRFPAPVGNVVFTSAVGFNDSLDQVFRHVLIIRQQLLGVLGQAVAAIAEGRVVIVVASAGQGTRLDDLPGVQALHLGIGIQLVKVRYAQGQIGIGKQLDGLSFGETHNQRINVLLDCAFLQQTCKGVGGWPSQDEHSPHLCDNDTARVEVIVQSLGFTQELRAEDDSYRSDIFHEQLP